MDSALLAEEFIRLPSNAESKAWYRAFYDTTSNAALEITICAGDLITFIPLASFPHASHLIPHIQHLAHNLYDGKLLQPDGNMGGGHNVETLQRAMHGNVSDLMPRPPAILASVVSVTFIGLGELPKHTVHEALRWLKENNTKYYGDIEINPQRIRDLPENNVPIEIWETICQCTNTGMVPQESDSYNDCPNVIPLQISGAIDTDLTNLSATELIFGDSPLEAPEENFFEKAYPYLFPYGCGGIEASCPYYDHRFHLNPTFSFALASAWIQIKRRTFEADARILSTITVEKLKKAQDEEDANQPISDPTVRLLRQHIHATAARIFGSDHQVWAMSVSLHSPSLWITINLSDLHDPVAQIFAGENINLDTFLKTAAKNIAADPYAAVKFFHFMIQTILQTLLGVEVTRFQVKSKCGILSRVLAYFGTVESQNRGSLHLHLLLWLIGAPMTFRACIVAYIQANLRAHDIKNIPNETDIAYARPPNLDTPDYTDQLADFERRLVRSQQLHTCDLRCCLRRAPFELSDTDSISILLNARCNNDGKLLTNGADTKNCTYYITKYALKKQLKHFNISAVMAKRYAYHRLLLFCLELAAPMVISYLMGWGDVY
ncbi:hypothetical protein OBBRIDRAFT_813030 [Obba rivulosa]|uniref:Helitron helicase-like domain-containing protein n=1 Tax=Obba rivulosa TaxID=1052685 RepID=A0A8E2B212_9APHY|nr:hypothetical protein OBBRIDRAFT_813030 [Obba rivulosa]